MDPVRKTLSEVINRAKQLETYLETLTPAKRPPPQPSQAKEYAELLERVRGIGKGILQTAEVCVQTTRDILAMLCQRDDEQDQEKCQELLLLLEAVLRAIMNFLELPSSCWGGLVERVKSCFEEHKGKVLVGGAVGSILGAVLGGCAVKALLGTSCAASGVACLSAKLAAEVAVVELGCIVGGAVIGAGLALLVIFCAVKAYDYAKLDPKQKELRELKQRLEKLQKQVLPSLEAIRSLRMEFTGVLAMVLPVEDTECWICLRKMVGCEQAHPTQGSVHQDLCACLPFTCAHPTCRKCAPKVGRCGLCQAEPRPMQRV